MRSPGCGVSFTSVGTSWRRIWISSQIFARHCVLVQMSLQSVTIFNRVVHNHTLSSIINSVLKSVSESLALAGCQTHAAAETMWILPIRPGVIYTGFSRPWDEDWKKKNYLKLQMLNIFHKIDNVLVVFSVNIYKKKDVSPAIWSLSEDTVNWLGNSEQFS